MAKLKPVLRAAVKNGEFPLSKEASFLLTTPYVALYMHEVKGKFIWLVEIEPLLFKRLLTTKKKYLQHKLELQIKRK